MKANLKLTTLVKIARHIESVLGVTARVSMNEMWADLRRVAGDCRTKAEAVAEISARIYNHEINGDYPRTDAALMDVR